MMQFQTDCLLLQCLVEPVSVSALRAAAVALCDQSELPLRLHRLAYSQADGEVYLYAGLHQRLECHPSVGAQLATRWQHLLAQARQVRVSRLERVFGAEGITSGAKPGWHYVVEMEPEAGWMAEIARWYDAEHMPGLAAVPGCIRAMRFLNHDHGPLSLACYDLARQETLNSPPWLAVRASVWSDITRPHFTHTKRTMFQVLGAA